jgi:hypothetical protein
MSPLCLYKYSATGALSVLDVPKKKQCKSCKLLSGSLNYSDTSVYVYNVVKNKHAETGTIASPSCLFTLFENLTRPLALHTHATQR